MSKPPKPRSTLRLKRPTRAAAQELPLQIVTRAAYSHFEKRLRDRWLELRAEIRDRLLRADAEAFADIAGQVHDAEDESLADLLVDINNAEVTRDVEEVRDIEAALQRIADGTYGTCLECRTPIARARLEAYPTAKRCLPCQQRHERTRAQPPRPKL